MVDSASAVTVRAGVLDQKRAATAARMIRRNMGESVAVGLCFPLVAAAVVILSGEEVVEIAAFHVVGIVGGLLPCPLGESGKGEAIEIGLFVHALSMAGLEALWGEWWTP